MTLIRYPIAAIALLTTTAALGQDRPRPSAPIAPPPHLLRERLGAGGPPILLEFESVRYELNLTDEQRSNLKFPGALASFEKSRVDRPEAMLMPADPSTLGPKGDSRAKRVENLRAAENHLAPDQARRLLEITLQALGPWALTWPEYQDWIGLDGDQRRRAAEARERAASEVEASEAAIRQLYEEAFRDRRRPSDADVAAWRSSASADIGALAKVAEAARAEADRALEAIPTPAQKARLRRLSGAPFDLSTIGIAAPRRPRPARP